MSNFVDPPDDYGPVIDYEDLFWDLSSESILLGPRLGEGSFGTVYKAEMTVDINNKTGYEVAVKYLKIKENPDRMEELRADFEYETDLMKTLNHPNIVKLLG